MKNPFRAPEDYELYVYSLIEKFPSIKRSTLTFIRLGSTLGRVSGEIHFDNDIRLIVRERVLYNRLPIVLDWYGYEEYRGEEKLYWYDSQPHPGDEELQSTHPHHKHIPPDVKHNRISTANVSFVQPNLPALINEIESL
ncbi:MAG: hypothetical protein FJ010_12590 [Chloroflexi bacterium]|nr:hypothetical protein [Chloroflexota bacterium]